MNKPNEQKKNLMKNDSTYDQIMIESIKKRRKL